MTIYNYTTRTATFITCTTLPHDNHVVDIVLNRGPYPSELIDVMAHSTQFASFAHYFSGNGTVKRCYNVTTYNLVYFCYKGQ